MAAKGKNADGDIADVNRKYYSEKGKAIYSDFSTFAQGSALATANAIEFADDFSGTGGEVIVCEYGIGKGDFAKTFLDEVKRRLPSLYGRMRYNLFDISEKMIADAKENLSKHAGICEFCVFDAAQELPSAPFDYCRINELLSDLPAEIYARKGRGVPTSNVFVQTFLSRMDDGRRIPFSFVAEKFLASLCACGKAGFRADIFDYGFYTADDIFSMPVEEWNRLVAREYGGQITVDLNFLQLSSALAAQGLSARVEPQKSYCERVLGMPLTFTDEGGKLDYLPKKEDDGVSEDDGFYRLNILG
jgi:SAM-dependent MidA family methyltransferase